MRFLTARPPVGSTPPIRRRRRSRWRAAGLWGTALVAISACGYQLHRSGTAASILSQTNHAMVWESVRIGFAVTSVEVQGRERASAAAILAALNVSRGSPILAIDPASAKQRLETVPWIRSATIYRRLPDTLFVRIVEQQPLAFWQRQGQLTLIDQEGRPIGTNDLGAFPNLPVLVGDDVPQTAAKLLSLLATEPELAAHVVSAVRVGDRRWTLHFDVGVDAALPEENPEQAWHRLAQFEKRDRILERDVTMVDLRLPDRVFLHFPPDSVKPTDKKAVKSGRPA
jgi:cell division protein FtsQ